MSTYVSGSPLGSLADMDPEATPSSAMLMDEPTATGGLLARRVAVKFRLPLKLRPGAEGSV